MVAFTARLSSPPRLDAAVAVGLGVVVLVHSQLLAGPGDLYVVRHAAGAERVGIDIDRRDEVLRLRVRDDGRTPGAPLAGAGLRGVVERAAALGGRAHARPFSGGFVVEAELPIHPSASAR